MQFMIYLLSTRTRVIKEIDSIYANNVSIPDNESTFLIVIDSGATASVTSLKEDFIDTIKPSPFHQIDWQNILTSWDEEPSSGLSIQTMGNP